jgi:hypothetical protein
LFRVKSIHKIAMNAPTIDGYKKRKSVLGFFKKHIFLGGRSFKRTRK